VDDESTASDSRLFYEATFTQSELVQMATYGWTLRARLAQLGGDSVSGSITVSVFDGARAYTMVFGRWAGAPTLPAVRLETGIEEIGCPEVLGSNFTEPGPGPHTYELRFDPVTQSATLWINGVQRASGYGGHTVSIGHIAAGVLWGANSECTTGAARYEVIELEIGGLTLNEAVSRSFTVVNHSLGTPTFSEAISRSSSVLNYALGTPTLTEAISRAATVTNSCFGDLDLDGDLDLADFQILVNGFGAFPSLCGSGDLDGDAFVDLYDLSIFFANMTGPQ
jgi:hypothetical protein